jgi:LacI family transcriptional regulator
MKDDIPDFTAKNGYTVMKELLESGEDFTAVYAISDLTAFGAYKAISEAGKKIPDDYSVVGFDGIDLTEYMTPSLTTMAQPKEDLAKATVQLLMQEIDGVETEKKVVFDAAFIERDSVRKI